MFLGKHTKVEPLLRESAKKLKQDQKRDLARNIKNMAIVFYSNHFNTIIYAK